MPATARGSVRKALWELLLSTFSGRELERFVASGPSGEDLRHEVHWSAAPAEVAFRVVDLLVERNLVDDRFFDRLRQLRPRRSARIDAVAAAAGAAIPDEAGPLRSMVERGVARAESAAASVWPWQWYAAGLIARDLLDALGDARNVLTAGEAGDLNRRARTVIAESGRKRKRVGVGVGGALAAGLLCGWRAWAAGVDNVQGRPMLFVGAPVAALLAVVAGTAAVVMWVGGIDDTGDTDGEAETEAEGPEHTDTETETDVATVDTDTPPPSGGSTAPGPCEAARANEVSVAVTRVAYDAAADSLVATGTASHPRGAPVVALAFRGVEVSFDAESQGWSAVLPSSAAELEILQYPRSSPVLPTADESMSVAFAAKDGCDQSTAGKVAIQRVLPRIEVVYPDEGEVVPADGSASAVVQYTESDPEVPVTVAVSGATLSGGDSASRHVFGSSGTLKLAGNGKSRAAIGMQALGLKASARVAIATAPVFTPAEAELRALGGEKLAVRVTPGKTVCGASGSGALTAALDGVDLARERQVVEVGASGQLVIVVTASKAPKGAALKVYCLDRFGQTGTAVVTGA